MTQIPLNPTLLASAQPTSGFVNALGVNSNVLPKEGEKCVPMQFVFDNVAVWLVDLNIALNSQSVSQLRSLYIDATACTNDAIVYFQETGFTVPVKAGYSNLVSIPEIQYGYRFYVSLDNQVLSATDKLNIIATNVMLPPFSTNVLFGNQAQQAIYQANNSPLEIDTTSPLMACTGAEQGQSCTLLQSNLGVMLIGLKPTLPANLFKAKIQIALNNSNSPYTMGTVLATHILTATENNIVPDKHARLCTVDYFFLNDPLLNAKTKAASFYYGVSLWTTLLAGEDGGNAIHDIYTSINWTYSFTQP